MSETDLQLASSPPVSEPLPSALDRGAVAEALCARYGAPRKDTDKLVAFSLADKREIALQRDIQGVQLWIEGGAFADCPVHSRDTYTAEQGRHTNLPGRLCHQPKAELRRVGLPQPVTLVRPRDTAELNALLDWYDAPGQSLDRVALEAMKQVFLTTFPDFHEHGFAASSGQYFEVERGYKQALLDRVREVLIQGDALDDAQCGGAILDVLAAKASDLLGWRTVLLLKTARSAHPGMIEAAAGILVRDAGDQAEAVERFVAAVWPMYAAGQERSLPYSDLRTIPTMVLALARPADALAIRYQPLHTAGVRLLHRSLFANAPLTAQEYRAVLAMARAIAVVMREAWGWTPRDLWDVQGFIWVTCGSEAMALGETANAGETTGEDEMTTPIPGPADRSVPTNLILYGPPGTGKTYETAREAVRLCDGVLPPGDDRVVRRRYDALVRTRQIRFVTFHQSYAYEDFVEGLRPTTGETDDGRASAGFRLMPVPGVFREIAALAEQARRATTEGRQGSSVELEGRRFWKMALGAKGSEEHVYQAAIADGYVALGWGGDVDFSDPRFTDFEAMRQEWTTRYPNDKTPSQTGQPWTFRNAMKVGDLVIVPHGNTAFRAIAEITGDYYFELGADGTYNQRRRVRWLLVPKEPLPLNTIVDGNFAMRTLYEIPESRILKEALLRLICGPSLSPGPVRPDQFVLVIDEINRANVSKVFGELITLLEADKRLGQDNALTVTLPYSGDTFGVPDNLHVIGTMNTADRSIALLDTALRRRFAFRELAPPARPPGNGRRGGRSLRGPARA